MVRYFFGLLEKDKERIGKQGHSLKKKGEHFVKRGRFQVAKRVFAL